MKISNPIFKELLKLKLINRRNLIKISNQTRDKKIPVYKDQKSKVIFLEKFTTNTKYYEAVKYNDKSKKNNKEGIVNIKTLKGKIKTSKLNDDRRRVFQFKKLLKNKNILDFGCGWGGFLSSLKTIKSATGIELRKECLNYIKNRLKKIFVTNNINNLNKKYDIITLFHILEHIPYQVDTLKNLKKKLSKNGKIIIEVPSAHDHLLTFESLDKFKKFTFWSEHLILHTENSLRKVLKSSGLKNIKVIYYQRYNLNNHLGWFVKNKPGGHHFFKDVCDQTANQNYIDYLVKNKRTDTLIAIASK
jgi:2-polyprenyl-3-methyl-5-hydroxy-6-metoxy-1,4-benzoquinol methylase